MGELEPHEFDEVLDEAKAEGNLSRANVARKAKGKSENQGLTRQQRADLIANLAADGYSSRQMPSKVGVTETTVRRTAVDRARGAALVSAGSRRECSVGTHSSSRHGDNYRLVVIAIFY